MQAEPIESLTSSTFVCGLNTKTNRLMSARMEVAEPVSMVLRDIRRTSVCVWSKLVLKRASRNKRPAAMRMSAPGCVAQCVANLRETTYLRKLPTRLSRFGLGQVQRSTQGKAGALTDLGRDPQRSFARFAYQCGRYYGAHPSRQDRNHQDHRVEKGFGEQVYTSDEEHLPDKAERSGGD
jgi:hypothetical protein